MENSNNTNDLIAGVVVLYNPQIDLVLKNIDSYIYDIGHLWIIDNSDNQNLDFETKFHKYKNSTYIWLGENKGIATALNEGFQRAIADGFKWILSMDQDSKASENMVGLLYNLSLKFHDSELKPGIIAAQPDTPTRKVKKLDGFEIMDSVIASGNLVNAEAYRKTGGFVDKLFIDAVDFEFSLAIRKAGYAIIQNNEAILLHNLGVVQSKSVFGIKMYPTNHTPIRFYYFARNRLYVHRNYSSIFPDSIRSERINYIKWWIKVFLFEKNKIQKIRMAVRGVQDFKNNKFGKFSQ